MITGCLLSVVHFSPPGAGAGTLYGAAHTGGPESPSTLYALCPSSGASYAIGPIGFHSVGAIDFHPVTGVLYGAGKRPSNGTDVLIVIDPLTGQGSEVGPFVNTWNAGGGGHFDLSFRPADGALFLTAFREEQPPCVSLYSVDTLTGLATEVGDTTTCSPGNALAFAPDDTLYHANKFAGGTLYVTDPSSGVSNAAASLTYVGFPELLNPRPNGMDFDPTSGEAWVSINDGISGGGPNYLAALATTGEVTNVGVSIPGLDGLAWDSTSTLLFLETVRATQGGFLWPTAVEFEFVRGSFVSSADVGDYMTDEQGGGMGNLLADPFAPPTGEGAWYLLRLACPDASWSSGGPGECPVGACPPGGRDSALP